MGAENIALEISIYRIIKMLHMLPTSTFDEILIHSDFRSLSLQWLRVWYEGKFKERGW